MKPGFAECGGGDGDALDGVHLQHHDSVLVILVCTQEHDVPVPLRRRVDAPGRFPVAREEDARAVRAYEVQGAQAACRTLPLPDHPTRPTVVEEGEPATISSHPEDPVARRGHGEKFETQGASLCASLELTWVFVSDQAAAVAEGAAGAVGLGAGPLPDMARVHGPEATLAPGEAAQAGAQVGVAAEEGRAAEERARAQGPAAPAVGVPPRQLLLVSLRDPHDPRLAAPQKSPRPRRLPPHTPPPPPPTQTLPHTPPLTIRPRPHPDTQYVHRD
ncbi:hypothetical protein FIBSPDRAFT_892820 [Athelia psychrophila]|uniref:Uncharacterized protein n=1 Tax=Athelia psychrophila TaxID=1759441 RepID=A0A166HU03_9AGAM|nr:hypothetical protein FIBSPDRAFT_892820 [Fibularhizoctonia sp. CBS 109695]